MSNPSFDNFVDSVDQVKEDLIDVLSQLNNIKKTDLQDLRRQGEISTEDLMKEAGHSVERVMGKAESVKQLAEDINQYFINFQNSRGN